MSRDVQPDWDSLLWEARGYLGLDENDPVPVDELLAQAKANGRDEDEAREALRDTDALEAVGNDPDDLRVRAVEENTDSGTETLSVAGDRTDPDDDGGDPDADTNSTDGDASTEADSAGGGGPQDAEPRETGENSGVNPETRRTDPGARAAEPGSPAGDSADSAGDSSAPVLDEWGAVDFATVDPDTYPPALLEREQWMGRLAGEKMPFSPWADRDHPEADPDNDARYKWGLSENYVDGETVAMAETDPRLDGRIFIQRDPDPFAFVDGDDVRCPETNAVHPEFVEILDRLGATYADVSTSGAGVHAYYRGELPNGQGQAVFDIDTEPWGENDDPPTVEIYANKHVCVATGEHVDGTPDDVHPWDPDAVETVLGEYDALKDPTPEPDHDTDRDLDLDDHDADATERDETTTDARDIALAVDRLTPSDLPLRARQVDTDATGWEQWDPSSYRPSSGNDSLHRPPGEPVFHDHKHGEPFGVLSLFAAEQGILSKPWDRLAGADWWGAVDAARDAGAPIPEYEGARGGADPDTEGDHRDDPREVGATVDPRRAWDAAGRVTPDDLPDDRLATDSAGETFVDPQGEPVDVVRAVALAETLVDGDEPLQGDAWREAYALAREEYDAPLPEYYTTADKIAEQQAVYDVIDEVTFWDLDTDALDSTVTEQGDEVGGDAVRALNPAWRESESGTSVLVFDSGTVWDADTELTLNAVRFVALDSGLISDPQEKLEGGDYTEAYRRAREEYAAPLPRWEPADDSERHVTPQLPPAEDLLENGDLDGVDVDHLAAARDENENLIREAVADDGETPTVIKSVPATGKTTGVIKTAADEADGAPLSYLSPRKELQQQALDKADRWGADAVLLPVFGEQQLDEEVLSRAVEHVREHGTDRLRDRWAVVDDALGDRETTPEALFADDEASDDEETVDLDRPTCDTADGEHGVAWALAAHVARALGYTPREIHQYGRALFGAPIPCSCDGDHDHEADSGQDCEYTQGWEPVTDPDAPPDLLVGSYTHAHVESVRTHYTRQGDTDTVVREPRALVFDEYPGGAFETEYGEEATDFATWLAGCLREDIADAVDMHTRDLWGDEWVRAWLDGEGDEADSTVADAVRTLDRAESLLEAAEAAQDVLDEQADDRLRGLSVYEPLSAVLDAPAEAFENLDSAVSRKPAGRRDPLLGYLESAVLDPLATATADGRTAPDADAVGVDDLPAAGDLRALVADALDRLREGRDGARAALSAASAALQGGEEGCRRLAAWATDGYAHPDAHHLLTAVAAPTGPDTDDAVGPRIDTDTWAFDGAATDGTVVDVVDTGDRARTVLDRNGHGAILDTPPSRVSGGGDPAPVVGLDATARRALWREVFHEAVSLADIHDTARERRQFLRETLDLRVLQAADKPRYYEGDPSTKDTVGDAALLRELAEEYAGIEAPRTRDDDPTVVGRPAAITTKQVRDVLQNSDLVGDSVTAWENFGNLTGANDLGEHRLAAVLGCQHYGDDAVERFAALAGESVDTDRAGGRGGALEYGSHAADEYLAHMRDDQTMQAVLRFARGDSGATVLARTSALREDLPVVGEAQVVGTWSDTARRVAQRWRELGEPFTAADVADAVDVSLRHVRRVLGELDEAGYLDREHTGPGRANVYYPVAQPGAGEVELPDRDDAVASSPDSTDDPGRGGFSIPYTWNVRVAPGKYDSRDATPGRTGVIPGAPPAPRAAEAGSPDD